MNWIVQYHDHTTNEVKFFTMWVPEGRDELGMANAHMDALRQVGTFNYGTQILDIICVG